MNNILLLHSEWLEKEGLTQRGKRMQETSYDIQTKDRDWRQTEGFSGRRRDERQVESNMLIARYKADIADATYKIKCFNDHEIVIPEHFDITGEIDKLIDVIATAEDKLAVLRLHYGEKKADKAVL